RGHKGIVVNLGNFMAEARHIKYGRIEKEIGLEPGRVVHHKSPEQVSVAGITWLRIKRVKSADAAAGLVFPNWEKQVGRRKEKRRDVLRRNVSRSFCGSYRRAAIRRELEGRRKQLSGERVEINQCDKAAASV